MSTISTTTPMSLGSMIRAGIGTLRAYSGLFGCLYTLQLAVAASAGLVMSRILVHAWAANPVFDQAVSGDVAAIIFVVRDKPVVFLALAWVALGALLIYAALSCYVLGGLNAVLLAQPRGRGKVARCFGAGGAATFLAYVRLALLALVPYAIVAAAAGLGLFLVRDELRYAFTGGAIVAALGRGLGLATVLWWLTRTAVDYARIELSHCALDWRQQSALRAGWRGIRTVLASWRPLAHFGLYALCFWGVSLLFAALATDVTHLLALFALRQIAVLIRAVARFALAAGQVAWASAIALRTDPSADGSE